MPDIRRILADAFDSTKQGTSPVPNVPVSNDWFEQSTCRNCASPMTTAYCGGCGQKAAKRFVWRDIRKETWERLRLFELPAVRTLRKLIIAPGTVAGNM